MPADIDVTFNFLLDTPDGKDPDRYNKTLRKYHRSLWSKRLPNGDSLELDDATPGHYLYHNSEIGEFSLSSDAVIPTFKWNRHVQSLVTMDQLEDFDTVTYTIGGMMVFPGKRIDGKWTINQARGCTGLLFLDGVYVYRDNRPPRFKRVKAPAKDELEDLVQLISQRVGRCLERQGLLEQDTESAWLELEPCRRYRCHASDLLGSSVSYRIAVGPQQGRKAFMIRTIQPTR